MATTLQGHRANECREGGSGWGTLSSIPDCLLLAALVVGVSWLILSQPVHPFIQRFDMASYLAMARDPRTFFDTSIHSHHAQRVLPSLLVSGLTRTFPLSYYDAFRILSGASYATFVILLYFCFRHADVPAPVAFGVTGLISISSWPMTYSLYNVYQANDAMTYPLALGIIALVESRGRAVWVALLCLLAVFTRQNLLVLALGALVKLWIERKQFRFVLVAAAVLAAFALNTTFAGGGAATNLYANLHPSRNAFSLGLHEARPWLLFFPFLLLLMRRETLQYAVKYWWVVPFVLVTVLQPVATYISANGVPNAYRLMSQGVWPVFLVAGFVSRDSKPAWPVQWLVAILPILYGLATEPFRVDQNLAVWAFDNEPWLYCFGLVVAMTARRRQREVEKQTA